MALAPGSTPAELRSQIRALAARAQTTAAAIKSRAEPILALIAETPAQLRAVVDPTRSSAVALNALGNALEVLAGRAPPTQMEAVLPRVATVRAQVHYTGCREKAGCQQKTAGCASCAGRARAGVGARSAQCLERDDVDEVAST